MKAILVFICIVAVALAQQDHCIDKAFHSHSILVHPTREFDDISEIWFDASTNKQRMDVHILEPVPKKIQVYLRNDLGKGYEYDTEHQTCRQFPLEGNLEPFCLIQNATKEQDLVLGGLLKCEVWTESVRGVDIRLVIAPGPHFGVPVNIVTKGGTHGSSFQEFWDFSAYATLPDQSVFNVPTACLKADAARSVDNKEMKGVEKARKLYRFLGDF